MRQKKNSELIVVGIGASAGGLEALQDFFKNMPLKTGLAFVVIQHLSPDYKSLMDELLARETKIPIHIITDGIKIKADNIYLIPPRNNISIFHDKMYLHIHDKRKGLNLPVDIFFRSLAAEKGAESIGVVLSGTGSDGTLGIKAIKEAGGMVMVQDEKTAKFDGMPKNVISTGLADYILAPSEMPANLIQFIKHPFMKKEVQKDYFKDTNLDTFTKIMMVLRDYGGVDFSYYKESTILRRLERRVSINRFNNLEDYLSFLTDSEKEKNILNREFLIGVTRFFREIEAFRSLQEKIFPLIAKKKSVRFWSAGCSTGEEVYSIAMLFNEYLEKEKIECDVKIFATDIDRNSIDIASRGFYPENIVSDVDSSLLSKYFTKVEGGYLINDFIRKNIVFAVHNILKDSPFSKIDLMICRNLFIYFKPNVQSKILSLIYYSIKPDGYLFMGNSETTGDMSGAYECLDTKWKIYKYKKGFNSLNHRSVQTYKMNVNDFKSNLSTQKVSPFSKKDKIIYKIISDTMPPSVLVDVNDNIIHVFNDVSNFLKFQSGSFSQNVFDHLPKELALFTRVALRKIRNQNSEIITEGIAGFGGENKMPVKIHAKKIVSDGIEMFLISFIYNNSKSKKDKPVKEILNDYSREEKIVFLEKDLQTAKESLQATVEELETSNEELQSSNEELIASNEELQSTNEELQSVNEELYTVNSEYQVKIDELTKLNNDMNNLLKNIEVGAIYLDRNMCIRKITPFVTETTNILNTDIGRPISHVTMTGRKNPILKDIEKVANTLQIIDKEIKLSNNRTYFTRIRPYRTQYNSVEGILVTFFDITKIKNLEDDIIRKNNLMEKILDFSPIAKTMVDLNGKIIYMNKKAEDLLGVSKSEAEQRKYDSSSWEITDLDGRQISSEKLPFSIIKKSKKPLKGFKHFIKIKGKKRKLLIISGVPIINGKKIEGVVFILEESNEN